jgi:hypothetical protein
MPRLMNKAPSYCRHKASGQAVVTLGGKDIYLEWLIRCFGGMA